MLRNDFMSKVIGVFIAAVSGLAQAQSEGVFGVYKEFKGDHWIDKQFESYNVTTIEVERQGKGSLLLDVTQSLADALRKKGYKACVTGGMGLQKNDQIDGRLKVTITTFGDARIIIPDGQGMNDFNINGKVELSVLKGVRKIIFKASGKTKSLVRRKSQGYHWWNLLVEEFSKIIEPLPRASRPQP